MYNKKMVSKVVTLIFTIIAISTQANISVTVSCEVCTITCSFARCFRLKGNGLDTQICSKFQNCNMAEAKTVAITNSSYDIQGYACTNKLIVYVGNSTTICSRNPSACNPAYSYISQCNSCVAASGCAKCSQVVQNGVVSGESCFGDTCENIGATSYNVAPCSGGTDAFSNTCQCCETMNSTTSATGLSVCLQGLSFLDNDYVVNWYKQQAAGNGEQKHIIFALLALLLFTMILY